jgi:hypothetical protein
MCQDCIQKKGGRKMVKKRKPRKGKKGGKKKEIKVPGMGE